MNLTATTLDQVAKLFGWESLIYQPAEIDNDRWLAKYGECAPYYRVYMSDGDLLAKIFKKASELHLRCDMTIHHDGDCRVIMDSGAHVGYGSNMLEATIKAFASMCDDSRKRPLI